MNFIKNAPKNEKDELSLLIKKTIDKLLEQTQTKQRGNLEIEMTKTSEIFSFDKHFKSKKFGFWFN